MDEHERRNQQRRTHDVEDITEVRLLRQQIRAVQDKLEQEEASDHRRLLALEIEVAEFRRRFAIGRGFFYGCVAVLGTFGVYLVDHLKEAIAAIK